MKLDHVALQVEDPTQAANWYKEKFEADIIYCDKTWSFVQLENIKIAFVVKTQHPRHIAFEVQEFDPSDKVKKHRDGSSSIYKRDPWGNVIEYIKYPSEEDHLNEGKSKGVRGRIRRKLQNWRSCDVDRRFCLKSAVRKKGKSKLWSFGCKKNKKVGGRDVCFASVMPISNSTIYDEHNNNKKIRGR